MGFVERPACSGERGGGPRDGGGALLLLRGRGPGRENAVLETGGRPGAEDSWRDEENWEDRPADWRSAT